MLITPFFGEVLILTMMAVCCLRTYFIKKTRLDAITTFAPLAFVISILQIISWGFNFCEILLFLISLIVFIVNYRSFIRFCNHLYVDTYSTSFIVFSSISLALIIFAAVVFTLYMPQPLSPKKYQVTVTSTYFSKQKDGSYKEADDLFIDKSLKLTVYSPSLENTDKTKNTVVLFVPDKRAGALAYEPYLVLLAKSGYKVYCGNFDFSTVEGNLKFLPTAVSRRNLIHNVRREDSDKKYFDANPQFYDAYAREFEILIKIADAIEPKSRYFAIVCDGVAENCFYKIKNPARPIAASFDLAKVSEYKTSGYGFIQQTDPLYAAMRYGLKKDKIYFVPSYAVMKTKNAIEGSNDIE
ncbi:MAG: hypothetical protein MJ184_02130 [Treponema sp.]|uniref:hypothetical protein n=1 Tax=Treponema sp. TaxID=166 RepID=UPI00298EAC10|nr:hypothetical protein [Treponema sp.]MCQ2600143.1 hypothetical protein [Treponema sp.]